MSITKTGRKFQSPVPNRQRLHPIDPPRIVEKYEVTDSSGNVREVLGAGTAVALVNEAAARGEVLSIEGPVGKVEIPSWQAQQRALHVNTVRAPHREHEDIDRIVPVAETESLVDRYAVVKRDPDLTINEQFAVVDAAPEEDDGLDKLGVVELRKLATAHKVKDWRTKRKPELIVALREARKAGAA